MANDITIDKVNVEIESNSSKASSGIDQLTASIKKLKSTTNGGLSELKKLNTTVKGITNNFNKIGNVDTQKSKRNISNTIKNMQKSFTGMSSKALREKFNIAPPSFNFDKFIKDKEALKEYGEQIKLVSKNGQTVELVFKKTADGIETVTTASKKGITQTEKYTKQQDKLLTTLKAIKGIGFLSIIKNVFTGLRKYTDMSATYISNMNYFNTTMGGMAEGAMQFVNTMEKDFYLDPSSVMNYTASFHSLIKGFGIAEEESALMSKNLTQLSYDLAAFKGISIEDAMQKIKSGISGKIICLVRKGLRAVTYLIAGKSKQESCR